MRYYHIRLLTLYFVCFLAPSCYHGHHRFCRLLSDFCCMSCWYETTDDKNGLLSSSWAFTTHEVEKKPTSVLSPQFEDRNSGRTVQKFQQFFPLNSSKTFILFKSK